MGAFVVTQGSRIFVSRASISVTSARKIIRCWRCCGSTIKKNWFETFKTKDHSIDIPLSHLGVQLPSSASCVRTFFLYLINSTEQYSDASRVISPVNGPKRGRDRGRRLGWEAGIQKRTAVVDKSWWERRIIIHDLDSKMIAEPLRMGMEVRW